MNVAPEAFALLVRLARRAGADPHDWAAVIYEESAWNPHRANRTGAHYYGLNQMGADEARSSGFRGAFPSGWLVLDALEQLPYVAAFFVQKRAAVGPAAFASAAHLLAVNFLPARVHGHAPAGDVDYALCVAGEVDHEGRPTRFYESNKEYDHARKGTITIRDLAVTLEQLQAANPRDTAALRAGVDAAIAAIDAATLPGIAAGGASPRARACNAWDDWDADETARELAPWPTDGKTPGAGT